MSLHRARIKTREEFKEIVCCDKVYNTILSEYGNEFIIDTLRVIERKESRCKFCLKKFNDPMIGLFLYKEFSWINTLLIDIDEHPLSQDEVNALLHNGVSQ